MKVRKIVAIVLIVVSVFMTAAGGYLDVTDQKQFGPFSKKHLWNDGLYAVFLATAILAF